jgi:hypothetical protein
VTPGVTLRMHAGQRRVIDDHRRFKVVVAGRRWGKTQTAIIAIVKRAQRPRQLIWYVAPTYRMARGIMWQELLEVIPRKLIVKVNETLMTILLVNKTRIELKGADKPDTLRGIGLHYLVMDEAQDQKEETWSRALRPTLASTRGDALIIGTPRQFNWLYDRYMDGQRGDTFLNKKTGKTHLNPWKSWQFPTITSPFIPVEEIEAAKADMDEKSFNQEFNASFESMAGRVYHAFDRKLHVRNVEFNPKLPIWIGQDFNIDPMSSVIIQPQKNGELWILDEIVIFGSNTQEATDDIAKKYFRHMSQITVYPDPAGNNRSHGRGESDLDIMREGGLKRLKFRRKHPPVADRVNAVNRMLKSGDGQIRVRVNPSCKHTIIALEQTIYKPNSRDVDKSMNIEHAADALGYCIDIEFPVRRIAILGITL